MFRHKCTSSILLSQKVLRRGLLRQSIRHTAATTNDKIKQKQPSTGTIRRNCRVSSRHMADGHLESAVGSDERSSTAADLVRSSGMSATSNLYGKATASHPGITVLKECSQFAMARKSAESGVLSIVLSRAFARFTPTDARPDSCGPALAAICAFWTPDTKQGDAERRDA